MNKDLDGVTLRSLKLLRSFDTAFPLSTGVMDEDEERCMKAKLSDWRVNKTLYFVWQNANIKEVTFTFESVRRFISSVHEAGCHIAVIQSYVYSQDILHIQVPFRNSRAACTFDKRVPGPRSEPVS